MICDVNTEFSSTMQTCTRIMIYFDIILSDTSYFSMHSVSFLIFGELSSAFLSYQRCLLSHVLVVLQSPPPLDRVTNHRAGEERTRYICGQSMRSVSPRHRRNHGGTHNQSCETTSSTVRHFIFLHFLFYPLRHESRG